MPQWLQRQLQCAFHGKDRGQIRMLNECWFSFREKQYGQAGHGGGG